MVGAVGPHPVEDRRGDRVAGRQLVGEALARGVEQGRALAAHRLGDQQAVEAGCPAAPARSGGTGRTRGRRGRRRRRRRGPARRRSRPRGWSSAATAPRRRRSPAPSRRRGSSPASVRTPWQRSPSLHSASAEVSSRTSIRGLGGDHRRQLRGDLAPGLAAAGVDDAAWRVAALEAERQLAVRVEVEGDAARAQLARPRPAPPRPAPRPPRGGRGRGRRRSCRRRAGRASRRARAPRPGRPGPRSWRSRRAACARSGRPSRRARPRAARSRGRRRRRRPRRRRSGQCRPGPRPSTAVTVTGRCLSTTATPSRSSTTPGAHPENAGRIRAIEALLEAEGWHGLELLEAPAASLEQVVRVHPPRPHRGGRGGSRRRRRQVDLDTVASPAPTTRRCARPAPPPTPPTACSAGGSGSPSAGLRPPGHHAERAQGDGLLPLQQRRDRAPPTRSPSRRRAGDGDRLGRPPRQRHPGGLLRVRPGALREHPPEPALPGDRAIRARPAPAPGRATRSTARSRPGRGRTSSCRSCRRCWCRSPATSARTCSRSRPATTPTATTRWPSACSTRAPTPRWRRRSATSPPSWRSGSSSASRAATRSGRWPLGQRDAARLHRPLALAPGGPGRGGGVTQRRGLGGRWSLV